MTIALQDLKSTFSLDSKGLQAGAKLAIAGVGALVAGITVAVKATMDWAKDLDTLGDVMDGSKKKLAALAFVARKSGVGVDTFTKANVLLEKSLLKQNGTLDVTGKKLKEYGIKVKDANGHVKDSVQLTDEIGKKYAELSTQTERINFLTEIYGKNGAALVDFYDTLAKEGGIDKVTQKVKAFGLAIDPDRYEQFSRNLEELKLVGLGLAVQFTEKIMPSLERFLGWLNTTAQSSAFKTFRDKLAHLFDFGGESGTKFDLKNKDRKSSFDTKLANMINGVDWSALGKALGEKIDAAFAGGLEGTGWEKTKLAMRTGLRQALLDAIGYNPDVEISKWLNSWLTPMFNFFHRAPWEPAAKEAGQSIPKAMGEGVFMGSPTFFGQLTQTIANANILIDNKLREIAKTFFNRALGWTQQMIAGFKSGLGGLLGAISTLVGEINAILKKIITSFTITIKLPSILGGSTSTGTTGSHPAPIKPHRATGGAVLAGHAYNVAEFNKAETFTPNTSGRVDPKNDQMNMPIELGKKTIRAIGREVQMNALKAA